MTVPLHFHSVHYAAVQPGPRLIVLGAVHGNETCGQRGILRVIDALNQQRLTLQRGSVTLVLDHYLEVLAYKPGALPGATALAQARKAGVFTGTHDRYWAAAKARYGDKTGTQALVRLLLMQRQRDAARGWDTRGFVSGYRGSPLGMLDQAIWKAGSRFAEQGIEFVPAINEELAATQVLGTQRVESDPERTVQGVFGMWYGKGPGVDRAGDALKHGNVYGSSPHGGVLVVAGDDHGCVSSSMPHQSDQAFQAWHMPVLQPAHVGEYLEFGLYGYELSRYSGAWVGMAALSEVVESGATVDLDAITARIAAWHDSDTVRQRTGHQPPEDGLHYRWPDLPSLRLETRLHDKLAAVAAFAKVNSIDRHIITSEHAQVGIITCGKAHYDLMEVLRRLQISPEMLARAGVRLYKVGLAFPLETTRAREFAQGLREILVIEEKGAVVEQQLRELFYNAPPEQRPALVGKHDLQGQPLVSQVGELRPSRLIELVAQWLARHGADAIIAQGLEAGGHRGHFLNQDLSLQQGTFTLLPQIVAAVDLPVIAAGGIVDGKGIKAALALGASAVQMGTAFLCCHEATTSPLHRAALQVAHGQHTALTNLFSGRPARGIVNRLMRELGPLSALPPDFPHASGALAPLRAAAEKVGDSGFSPLWAGQNVSGCRSLAAAELIAAWVAEADLA